MNIKQKTIELIDALKATCQTYGMGNDGNEYKIITQVFLYKFLNDKFGHEMKKISTKLASAEKWEITYNNMSEEERLDLFDSLSADVPRLLPEHLLSNLWNQQTKGDFDLIFDNTMIDIANKNIGIFSTQTAMKKRIPLFEKLTQYVTDESQRAPFARALVNKLANFSFESAFSEHYDFFATIFEYLIKDYNTAGGGKYAEYYTPHSIATIMARLLVGNNEDFHSVECYDPSAGTGTLLMALAHQIGEDRCTIFAQDISQRSNKMLKLNLILNGLVASLDYAIQGDTLVNPFHKSDDGNELRQFDFIVSNPPFNMDFSDTRKTIAAMPVRFWAGVPNIPKKKKTSMAIYTCFIQHVLNSLKDDGKAAIVVPSGFLDSQFRAVTKNGPGKISIDGNIRQKIIDNGWLRGVVSMPKDIFAATGTNVSVLFIDKNHREDGVILIDASKMGHQEKIDNKQKTVVDSNDLEKIVSTFLQRKNEDEFSVVVSNESIKQNDYSFKAGHYFDVKVEYSNITKDEFEGKIKKFEQNLEALFDDNKTLEKEIRDNLKRLKYEKD